MRVRFAQTWSLRLAMTAAAIAGACTGTIGEPPSANDSSDNPVNPGNSNGGNSGNTNQPTLADVVPIAPHLHRLTSLQYANTVEAALGPHFDADDMPDFGDDIPTLGLSNDADLLRISSVNVAGVYGAAEAIAARAVEQNPTIAACVAGSGTECFSDFARSIGQTMWRRPLTDREIADIETGRAAVAEGTGTRAEQAEYVVQALMLSSNTLYRSALGAGTTTRQLTGYELASVLSYTMWNEPPDAELMAAAADGSLANAETLRTQARRLGTDPRFARALVEFYFDYLKLSALFRKDKAPELGLTTPARQALWDGAKRDLFAALSSPDATLFEPFETLTFHVNDIAAPFFGVTAPSSDFSPMMISSDERLGILTHPAFLSVHAGTGNSGIVKRGVFTLEQLMCVHLGAPPANIGPVDRPPEGFDPEDSTERDVLETLHTSQAQCRSCHQYIDPAGFGFENFDGVGRYRTTERVPSGRELPIDASGNLRIGTEQLQFQNSVQYIQSLIQTPSMRRCVSDALLAYMLGNTPGEAERAVFYATVAERGARVADLAELIVSSPSYTVRTPPTN